MDGVLEDMPGVVAAMCCKVKALNILVPGPCGILKGALPGTDSGVVGIIGEGLNPSPTSVTPGITEGGCDMYEV